MKTYKNSILIVVAAGLFASACVDHRPIRNGLLDESVYLDKSELTAPNPKLAEPEIDEESEESAAPEQDIGWLFKVSVVQASSPNVVGAYAFPGLESDLKYVKFRFAEDSLQVLDGRQLQTEDPNDDNDDLPTRTDRVMLEFEGKHVDVKLRESLDGERTNFIEENTENGWQERQQFKVDFERSKLDPVANIAWFYGDFMKDCATITSQNMVPDSFEWDADSRYLSWVVEANYKLTVTGGCYDMVSLANDVGTATIRYRFSFFQPDESSYEKEEIEEKAEVNKKYGAFQVLNLFRDPETGLLGGKSLLQRWDPNREEPVVFYFHEGFPPRFKGMFEEIKEDTNRILEKAGAKLRLDFKDHDHDGEVRKLGDVRYSFAVWHQDIDTTRGLLGYGPSSSDPRTGEVLSANLHLYNVGLDYYRYLIEDYLEVNGGVEKPDPEKEWDEITCEPGEVVAPDDDSARFNSTLFEEMRRTMDIDLDAADDTDEEEPKPANRDVFVPTPKREQFRDDYLRMLSEYRYTEPGYNAYVYRGTRLPLKDLDKKLAVESEFQTAMHNILMNESPFGPVALQSPQGIEAQEKFVEDFRKWRKNHDKLKADQDILFGLANVYTVDDTDAIKAIASGGRKCTDDGVFESDEQFSERIIEDVVFHVAIHELGHNLGLRHNFYGSIDAKHTHEGDLSSSVMDYVSSFEEAGTTRQWGQYDEAALGWIYGSQAERDRVMDLDMLYCTDEHRMRSPLCTAHDLGVTPSQIVLNAIERYDWLYKIRNQRSYRTFWDTSSYPGRVYSSIFPLLRMWYLSIFDWGGGGVQQVLKRIDQVDEDRPVLTDPEYDEISVDFYNDSIAANRLITAFFGSVINQPASFRNYQTDFDPFHGDVLRLGIVLDKLFTAFAFMDLQDVYNYNPNVQTFVSMYDAPFGTSHAALSQRVLDDMLGSSYDTFPWFRYMSIQLFASAANSNLVSSAELKERILIQRYESLKDLQEVYGDAAADATASGNPAQVFIHEGEQYVYTYLADRSWHLVAKKSRSPVSYRFMEDYNKSINASASETEDTFGLKILLAYHEYYNNFSGF